jgi:hypothetical protein
VHLPLDCCARLFYNPPKISVLAMGRQSFTTVYYGLVRWERGLILPFCLLLMTLPACTHRVSMVSGDGEQWHGRWRYSRGDNGLMQIRSADGEILMGTFSRVRRRIVVEGYEKVFGPETIALDGPDLARYGNAFTGILGTSSPFTETAYAEPLTPGKSGAAVSGPLFFWTANLQGDRRTTMRCFLIGSAYTGRGIGRCRGPTGKDYLVEF